MVMDREAATPHGQILKAEDLLARMRSGIKEVYEISCRDLVVPVRVLTLDELAEIKRTAIRQAALVQGDDTDRNVYTQKTVLKLASKIDPGGVPFLSDKLLAMMTMDEVQHLYGEYCKIADDMNPALEKLSQEQFRALIEAVKKNAIVSKECSLRQLRAIFTAYQDLIQELDIRTLQADNSSGGQL